jgi:transposase
MFPACPGCRERDVRIAALEARIAELEARSAEAEAELAGFRAKLDAANSKQQRPRPAGGAPPSLPPAPAKKPSSRKAGGQPGHPPHLRQLLPPERVSKVKSLIPSHCEHCRAALPENAGPDDPEPTRFQVIELPPLAAHVVEYQGHARFCPDCGQVTRAAIPEGIRAHSVGPRLTAIMSYLVGCHHVSKRGVEEIVETVFGAPISLGTVSNLEREMSAALEPPYAEAIATVREAPVKHLDETGWKKAGRKRWLWVAATTNVAAFLIHTFRNVTALRRLLGTTLKGLFCTDRLRTYDGLPVMRRQVCWAHLKRNFEKLIKRGGKAKAVGEGFLEVQERVFELWHLFRGGGCTRRQLGDRIAPFMMAMLDIIEWGERSRDAKTVRFCAALREVFPALWLFVVEEGVEPTNNHAERVQRLAVLWRKCCFGCHSDSGCRFVERLLTVVQSLRLQKRNALDFLHDAIAAYRAGRVPPKLVLDQ